MTTKTRAVTKQTETRASVLDLIEQLDVGDAIPSERQLCSELGVSRLTVRAALDDLVRDGMLVRRHGSGTFVSEPKIAQELTMTSFTEDMRRRGMVPGSRTLDLHVSPAGPHLGRLLHVSPSEPVVVIKRVRLADHETMAIETLHVRESLVPGLTRADLEQRSFYDILQERFGIEIVGGLQTIEPTVTNEEESEASASRCTRRLSFRADDPFRDRRDRRVRPLDVPGRPLQARDRAQPGREPRPDGSARRARGRLPRWSVPHCDARQVMRRPVAAFHAEGTESGLDNLGNVCNVPTQ